MIEIINLQILTRTFFRKITYHGQKGRKGGDYKLDNQQDVKKHSLTVSIGLNPSDKKVSFFSNYDVYLI